MTQNIKTLITEQNINTIYEKRFVDTLFGSIGKNAEIKFDDNKTGNGVFYSMHPNHGGIVLNNFKYSSAEKDQKNKDKPQQKLCYLENYQYVLIKDVQDPPYLIEGRQKVSAKIKTDRELTSKEVNSSRTFQQWDHDEKDDNGGLEEGKNSNYKATGEFDQFKVNEEKFGLDVKYDENMYTSELNMKHVSKELQQKADKALKDLLKDKDNVQNRHVLEDRGQLEYGQDDEDEEAIYSAVLQSGRYGNKDKLPEKAKDEKKIDFNKQGPVKFNNSKKKNTKINSNNNENKQQQSSQKDEEKQTTENKKQEQEKQKEQQVKQEETQQGKESQKNDQKKEEEKGKQQEQKPSSSQKLKKKFNLNASNFQQNHELLNTSELSNISQNLQQDSNVGNITMDSQTSGTNNNNSTSCVSEGSRKLGFAPRVKKLGSEGFVIKKQNVSTEKENFYMDTVVQNYTQEQSQKEWDIMNHNPAWEKNIKKDDPKIKKTFEQENKRININNSNPNQQNYNNNKNDSQFQQMPNLSSQEFLPNMQQQQQFIPDPQNMYQQQDGYMQNQPQQFAMPFLPNLQQDNQQNQDQMYQGGIPSYDQNMQYQPQDQYNPQYQQYYYPN